MVFNYTMSFEKHDLAGHCFDGVGRFVAGSSSLPERSGSRVSMNRSNLVDPASSHTLVSKIKPCMSKYKQLYGETANGSLYQL